VSNGRFLSYAGNPHNQLLTSLVNLYGIPAEGFGELDFPGALAGLA
jgi:hypothetical protein